MGVLIAYLSYFEKCAVWLFDSLDNIAARGNGQQGLGCRSKEKGTSG